MAYIALGNFSPISLKGHDFRKEKLNIKCVILYSLLLLSEIFLILKRMQRNIVINIYRSTRNLPFILSYFEFSRHIFEKILECHFSLNSCGENPVVPSGETNGTGG